MRRFSGIVELALLSKRRDDSSLAIRGSPDKLHQSALQLRELVVLGGQTGDA